MWSYIAQQLINALSYGSILGLLAVGYTMIYGILGLINFAHGEIFMIGAFACYLLSAHWNLPWIVCATGAVLASTAVGVMLQRFVYKPCQKRKASVLTMFIASFAASLGLRFFFLMLYTDDRKPFPIPEIFDTMYFVGDVAIGFRDIAIFISTIVVMLLLTYFIRYTKIGIAMRAVSFDLRTAEHMGVNSEKIIVAAFVIGSLLAGLSAIEYGLSFGVVNPSMGFLPGLSGFIAAVIGGIGNVPGAMLGGYIIGVGEVLFVAALPTEYSPLRPLFVWALLLIILFLKPSGLFRPNVKFEGTWEN